MKSWLSRVGPAGVCSLALVPLVVTLVMGTVMPLLDPMPAWDQWSMVEVFRAHDAGEPVLPLLLAHYNGHYNCLPRFVFYAMGLLTRWDLRAEVLAAFFWAAAALALLLRMVWETNPRLLILAAPIATWVFSLMQFANFLNGYGMGQLMATFAALLALYLLTDPRASRTRFALALFCAAGAFFSHGAGIALAPAGLVALLFVSPRPRWVRIGAWSLVAAFGIGLGVAGGQNVELAVRWRSLPALTATLVGRPFTLEYEASPPRTAALGGLILVALVGLLGWRVSREWATKRALLVRWGCVALLPVAAAVLISVGRSAAPLSVVMRSHYVTSTYPLGIALLVLLAGPLLESMRRATGTRRRLLGAAVVVWAAEPAIQQAMVARALLPNLRVGQAVVERNARRLAIGTATDQDIREALHPVIDLVRSGTEFLRARDMAWFAHAPEAHAPFGALERVGGEPTRSTMSLRRGSPWVFEGWALPPLTQRAVPVEVALIVDGAIVARASPDRPRADLEAYYRSRDVLLSGFALPAPDGPQRPPGRYQARVVVLAGGAMVTLGTLDLVVAP